MGPVVVDGGDLICEGARTRWLFRSCRAGDAGDDR